ncbi:Crp/Fnr family transcriptional regulator [Bradyrhizobium sp. URHD0069]|uniref:Crp/Fnr family transcriptional regulator n=1 Tax=Bradyrhizobium sp. URHD0069 TaxID=1380355 RepID=UPI00068F6F37|nr:Crp/Fnr family transcriptional regulator [Bradyrhizobium sp. URHD0069]
MLCLSSKSDPRKNQILANLKDDAFELLKLHSSIIYLDKGTVICEAGDKADHVYFPHDGMVSLLAIMKNGQTVETSTVGRDGVIGAMVGLGHFISSVRAIVQLPMNVSRIPAARFRQATAKSKAIEWASIHYNEVLLSQTRILVACNTFHSIEKRFCRMLLRSADYSQGTSLRLTQEFMAQLLGVRRTSVTQVADRLQRMGFISLSRGLIHISNREALETLTCGCYQSLLKIAGPETLLWPGAVSPMAQASEMAVQRDVRGLGHETEVS